MNCHRGHKTVFAKKVLEREMDSLRDNSFERTERMLLKVREAVDSVSNMVDSLKKKGEKTKSRIQKHFKEIRDALESREQLLLCTTEEIVMFKVDKLEAQRKALARSKDDLEDLVRTLLVVTECVSLCMFFIMWSSGCISEPNMSIFWNPDVGMVKNTMHVCALSLALL